MDCMVHGVTESQTGLSDSHFLCSDSPGRWSGEGSCAPCFPARQQHQPESRPTCPLCRDASSPGSDRSTRGGAGPSHCGSGRNRPAASLPHRQPAAGPGAWLRAAPPRTSCHLLGPGPFLLSRGGVRIQSPHRHSRAGREHLKYGGKCCW